MNKAELFFQITVRGFLILFYPLWLIFGLIESYDWKDFRDVATLPFRSWDIPECQLSGTKEVKQ